MPSLQLGHEILPPAGRLARAEHQCLAMNALTWRLPMRSLAGYTAGFCSGLGWQDPDDKLHFLELFAGTLASLLVQCTGLHACAYVWDLSAHDQGIHIMTSAMADKGLATHALDLQYSRKLNINTGLGFIVAVATAS